MKALMRTVDAANVLRRFNASSSNSSRSSAWQRLMAPQPSTATIAVRHLSRRRMSREEIEDTDVTDETYMGDSDPTTFLSSTPEPDAASSKVRREAKAALESKTGRLWQDPWDLEEVLNSKIAFDDLPDWTPEYVSRTSLERVQIHPNCIPTLEQLAELPLPPPPMPHPGLGQAKSYALYRKRHHYRYVAQQVRAMAVDRVSDIQKLTSWQDKQDAVDALFEELEAQLQNKEPVLGKHPNFGAWVERGLEEYLRSLSKVADGTSPTENESPSTNVGADADATAVPVFMECFGADDAANQTVPTILSPLSPNSSEASGRLVEEWELAAHPTSRRILLRQSTRAIARALLRESSSSSRVLVHGQAGVGKTAALAAIVASARKSGCVVLYLPDGDNLRRHGYYVEPNSRRPGVYDLPVLSQRVCRQVLDSHANQLEGVTAGIAVLDDYLTQEQRNQLTVEGEGISVADLLRVGADKTALAPMCYAASMHVLKEQDQFPFVMVLDEFNCYFMPGQYFHAEYDSKVQKAIPYHRISLFQPALEAAALSEEDDAPPAVPIRRGGIVLATSESRGVARTTTEALLERARLLQHKQTQPAEGAAVVAPMMHVVEVPRLSALEVEHMLSHFECTGVGKLRLDRGETVRNEQEVQYLRLASGGVAQKLLDACII